MSQDQDNLRKLYDAVGADYKLPDFETFKADMQDSSNRRKLYDAVSADYQLPDYNTFQSDMGFVSAAETPVAEKKNSEPSSTQEATVGFSEYVNPIGSAISKAGDVGMGWLKSIFKSDEKPESKKADKLHAKAIQPEKFGSEPIAISEFDRNAISKAVAEMPEKLRTSEVGKSVFVNTYSKKRGIDKRAVIDIYDKASNARKAIDQLELEYYGAGPTVTPEGVQPAPEAPQEDPMKKFGKLYELARMYNYVGDHDRAANAYKELERGLFNYGSSQLQDENFRSRVPKNYLEQLQAPAVQGMAYTKHLQGDKSESDRLYKILENKGLLEKESDLEQVGTGDIMQPEAPIPSTYGFTGKRGTDTTPTPESQYLNDMSDAIANYGLPGVKGSVEMATRGMGKFVEGAKEAGKQIVKPFTAEAFTGKDISALDNLKTDLKMFTGLVETGAGVAGLTTPEGAVFSTPFFTAQNYMPPEAAEWLMPISKIVKNYYADKGQPMPEWAENTATLFDFAVMGLAAKGIGVGREFAKNKRLSSIMDETLTDLSPEAKDAIFSDIEKRYKATGENPAIYAEEVKNKIENEIAPKVDKLNADLEDTTPTEPYKPQEAPDTLGKLTEGTEVEYQGQIGKIERGDDYSWNIVYDDGRTVEIPVKDKTNATEKLTDLGISTLPEIPEKQVSRAMADAEQVGRVEYKGKQYFVSLDRVNNPEPNGDFVLEVLPDGRMVDRFSNNPDANFAADRKLAITNAFLESKGLPKRARNIEPWKESERYQVQDGIITYEPEAFTADGKKGKYFMYDNDGSVKQITESEYNQMKEYGTPVKTKGYEAKTVEGEPISGEPAKPEPAKEVSGNAQRRTQIRQDLVDLRNKGLLVTADKGIVAKVKRAVGVKTKKVPMTDAEIDANMSLLDAMSNVWKKTTGKDNFYEEFISGVEQGDIDLLKVVGGVLFQDVSNPVRPQSRVTLAVLETPQFKQFEGKQVNPQQIAELMKSRGKQIEKDIVNYVLSQEKYKGLKRIDYNEFRSDVDIQVMKLEKIETSSYADYGMDTLGSSQDYGDATTVILNSPLDHGQVGHFPRDFKVQTGVKTEWEVVQLGDTDTYAAVDKNRPSGLSPAELPNYVGTAGNKASVEAWVKNRNESAGTAINKGLFGHFRAWFDKATGIFNLAEMQSDYFQKHKASEQLMEGLIDAKELDAYVNKKAVVPMLETYEKLKALGALDYKIKTDPTLGNKIIYTDKEGNVIYEKIESNFYNEEGYSESPGLGNEDWFLMKTSSLAHKTLSMSYYEIKSLPDGTYNVMHHGRGFDHLIGNYKTKLEADFVYEAKKKALDTTERAIEEIIEDYRGAERKARADAEKEFRQQKAEEFQKGGKGEDLTVKQFINSQKIHEQRILREALQYAADNGATTFRFPTPKTLATIEKYIGSESAPYEVISGDSSYLGMGDIIEYGGEEYIVLSSDRTEITVAPRDQVMIFDRYSYISDEAINRVEEIKYALSKEVNDMSAITREELKALDLSDEYMGKEAYYVLMKEFAKLGEEETLSWEKAYDSVYDAIYREYQNQDFFDLVVDYGAETYMDDYGNVAYVTERRGITETFRQPDEYAPGDNVNWKEDLSKDQEAVVNKYEELNKEFKKMRGDVVEVTDGNGHVWLESKITEGDAKNPILAFQKSGSKVKAAVDFLNDNKATVSIFDGADISSLVHEFSGHIGRRFLERLSEMDEQFAKDYEAIKKWANVKDNLWTTRSEELFARAFERYIRTGTAPTPELTRVFQELSKWMKNIYETIKGSDIDVDLTPEVREVFDRMLGKEKTEPEIKKPFEKVLGGKGEVTPAVGDTVTLEPAKEGAEPRKMVYTEQGWKEEKNGKQVKVGGMIQEAAGKAWEGSQVKPEEVMAAPEVKPMEETAKVEAEVKAAPEAEVKAPVEEPTKQERLKSFEEVASTSKGLQKSLGIAGMNLPFGMPTDLWKSIKAGAKKYFTPMGGMPKDIFNREIRRGGSINAAFTEVKFTINDLYRAVKKEYGKAYNDLPNATIQDMNRYLQGDKTVSLPADVTAALNDMRQQIDNLSRTIVRQGLAEGDLAATITENMGVYLTRTYRKFREPEWANVIPETLKNQAAGWIRSEYPDLTPEQVDGLINHLLYTEGAPMDVIKGAKIGSKNLDILKGRKDIPEALRLLWGEYKDPIVNYMTSIQKMATLIENDKFLNDLYDMGIDKYFFSKPTGEAYVPLAGLGSKSYSPLNGMFTTPEIKEALTLVKNNVDKNWVYRNYMALNAYVKLGKTAYSIMTHVRNFLSNTFFVISNGHYLYPTKVKQTWNTVKALFQNKSDFATLDYIKDLQKEGVIGEALDVGEVRTLLKESTTKYSTFEDFTKGSFLNRFAKKTIELYQLEDTVYKVFAFEVEKSRYLDAGYLYKDAVSKAAENVRNTYPNYRMVPKIIKEIGKTPFIGTFVSFPTEVVRTYLNTWELAIKEMKDPKLKKIGSTRLAGLILTTIGIKGVAMALKAYKGVTDKEEKALRRFQPPWTEFSDFMYTGWDKNVPTFIDFGGTDPYSYLKTPINAVMMNEEPGEAVKDATWSILKPYFSEELLASKLLDVSRNTKDTGGKIYYETDPIGDKVAKSVAYVSASAQPGFVSQLDKIYKGYKGETGPYGRKYDFTTELIATTLGQRIVKTDIIASFGMKTKNFSNSWAETSQKYAAAQYQRKGEEEIQKVKESATESRKKLFEELKKDFNAAEVLGQDSYELEEIMKKNRIPRNVIDAVIYDDEFETLKELEPIKEED